MRFIGITFIAFLAIPALAKLDVVATLPDFAAIAQEIGGEKISVSAIAKGAEDAHFIDARPSFIRRLNQADLLIEGGADLEIGWLPPLIEGARNRKIALGMPGRLPLAPSIELLDVPTGVVNRAMGDVHAGGNPHFWLDPSNGKVIAQVIAGRLSELDASNTAFYAERLKTFVARLDEKTAEWAKKMVAVRGLKVITYHKSYEYLARRFGFIIVAHLEPKPGIEPKPAHIKMLIQQSKGSGVRLVIMEPFRPRRTAEHVAAAIGAKVVVLPDKVGSDSKASDYFQLFDTIVERFTSAVAPP